MIKVNIELTEEERYLFAHISDLAAMSFKTGVPHFSRFLNEREAIVASYAARTSKANPYFYGGYDGAARTICGFFDGTYADEMPRDGLYPLRAVTFSFRMGAGLCHRDFLGGILGLGFQRSAVGDILIAEDYAVVFCTEESAELILGLEKIGRAGVNASEGILRELPRVEFVRAVKSVSSLRLDCVVCACTNISREKSASLIKSGQVSADFSVCLDVSTAQKAGSIISIRGYGRYRLSEIIGETKKGRVRVAIDKYV